MSPITHFLLGWLLAEIPPDLSLRDRCLIAAAGVIPDVDGLGAVVELATRESDRPLLWFSRYHHTLHGLLVSACVAAAFALLARRRMTVLVGALAAFHLHLLCDLVGARGPDGTHWPIPYLWPFTRDHAWSWGGQWPLDGWPNFAITGASLLAVFLLARKRGYSPLSIVSRRADRAFIETLRRRFPTRAS